MSAVKPLTLPEARALVVSPEAVRLLAPREVIEHGLVPLAIEAGGDAVVVAVDAAAPDPGARYLRLVHGMRRVMVRPAQRDAIEHLLATWFEPYWRERGWEFAGMPATHEDDPPAPPPAAAEPARTAAPAKPAAKPAAGSTASEDHPLVLCVENDVRQGEALALLLEEAGYEPRLVGTRADVERELRRAPPQIVTVRARGAVAADELLPLVSAAPGRPRLRVVPDYARALLAAEGSDERLPRFVFDVSRFFLGVITAAGGGRLDRTEARARYAERTARRIGLPTDEIDGVRFAALLVDAERHLRSLRADADVAGDADSSEGLGVLEPLLDPARTPFPLREMLAGRHEHYDGSGPGGRGGDRIHAGARVLAAVEAFLDLREDGGTRDAIDDELRRRAGSTLDPRVVEALLRVDRADRLVDRLDEDRPRVLIVDPDPAAASLLEMRLENAGFAVELHRDGRAGLTAIQRAAPALVFSEVAMPGMDGLTLLLRLRKAEATADLPFLFVSAKADRSATVRGLELGADDFFKKPVDLELVVAKAKALVRRAKSRAPTAQTSGVSGDLAEMELMDLLQVLAASGRTVRIRLESDSEPQGELHLERGRVRHACVGAERGVAAFYTLTARRQGRFVVESSPPGEVHTIDEPLEYLLLEACRLRDEAAAVR